jgi:hypothetical protein
MKGIIESITDRDATTTIIRIEAPGRSVLVPMDHRTFCRLARHAGYDLFGRLVETDGLTIEFLESS